MKPIVAYITASDEQEAASIANALVKKKLASCVMVIPGIHSHYRWKGKLEHATEVLLLAKTFDSKFKQLEKVVKGLHCYDVPCIIAVPVTKGSKDYLDWSKKAVK